MKAFGIHILLIATVLLSQLYNSSITAIYHLNYDYYATVLCENQDQPELHCDGKCYFSQQLKLSTNSQKHAEPPAFLPILPLFAHSTHDWASQKPPTTSYCTSSCYSDPGTMSPHLADIDHPPKV